MEGFAAGLLEEPITLPKGAVLKLVAHDDNSAGNARNPNKPPKLIKWGEGTNDEMCIGFIAVTKKDQDLTRDGEKDDLRQILDEQFEGLRKDRPGKPAILADRDPSPSAS